MADESDKQLKYLQNQKMMERISAPETAPEPPIKMAGSINLGNIDFQAQAREAQERMEKVMAEREKEIKEERARRETAESEVNKMRIETLQTQFNQQFTELQKMVAGGLQKPKSFMEQFNEVKALTTELNSLNPTPKPGAENPTLQLEMLKIQAQMAREEREFKREMRNDEKKWQLEVEKLNIARQAAQDKLKADREHQEFLASSIKGVGAALAAGLISGGKDGGMEEPGTSGISSQPKGPTSGPKQYKAEARPMEAGELTCPTCQQPVGIGPTTTRATCVNCGSTIDVTRKESDGI